jgi:diguanylate cyclase (GGDEF)-like protein
MLDRRHPVRLTKGEIVDADAVLSMLAGHIRMRVYQKRLEYAYSSLRNMVNKAGIEMYVNDFYTHELLFINESQAAAYGGAEKVLGMPCWKVLYPDKKGECDFCPKNKLVDGKGNPVQPYIWDSQRPSDGAWFRVVNAAVYGVDGRLAHIVSSINITENKNNEMLIRHLAEYDTLTSLPNRDKLEKDLNKLLSGADPVKESGYLIFMDLDGFKAINDTYRHQAGNDLLRQIGHFLSNENETLGMSYRYCGDEFVIVAENKSEEDLGRIRDLLMTRFSKKWRVHGKLIFCGVSAGVVPIPQGGKTAEELIDAADMAMYEVKKNGKHGFRLLGAKG